MTPDLFKKRLARERRARHEAERLLEKKAEELYTANQELARYADELTEEIESTQQEYIAAKSKAETLQDQTTRIKRDLKAANRATILADQRLWDAVEGIEDGFALYDQGDRLVSDNVAHREFWSQISPDIGLGSNSVDMLTKMADSGLVDFDEVNKSDWLKNMRAWYKSSDQEHRIIRLKGDHWLKASQRKTRAGDAVTLISNISIEKRRERDMNAARKQAEAANRAKSAFLANMSHEIRTPMNGVVGMADLLCETSLNAEQQLFAQTIRNSGEALLVIINDVLDYSKIEAGKLDLFPEPFNLERCVHEVVMLLQPRAREKNLDLLIDYDMFLPAHYSGDAGRIRQVLTNLVGNAIKFTESGFVLVRVVGFEDASGRQEIHVAVEDSGIGIAADKLDHVFGEFNQVDDQANRKFEGTGLGLAITKRLITLMGGEIWADSTVGKGSCFGFRIRLPITGCNPAIVPKLDPTISRALIVDDLEVNRAILARQLGFLGITVTDCDSGTAALDTMLAQQNDTSKPGFDVVLTDHQMPGMDGIDFAQALRDHQIDIPVLLLSSTNSIPPDLRRKNLFAGYLHKPILRSDLCNTLTGLNSPRQNISSQVPDRPPQLTVGAKLPTKLLTAEDNKTNRLVLQNMVRGMELEMDFAVNGVEAVQKFQAGAYDLIFMDISMPEMDGIEATRQIRILEGEHSRPRIPIVALTAHAMSGDKERFLAAGMDHYMTKPLKKARIAAKIAEITAADPLSRPAV